jgi:hypothetical protein
MSAPQYLFLPIRPQWALSILDGAKKWELRTKRPSIDAGDVVILLRDLAVARGCRQLHRW